MLTKETFVTTFPAFRTGPDALIGDILASSRTATFPEGRQIYAEGDACSVIAFVLGGEVRVYKSAQSGREITLYEIGAGETCILNASCVLSGTSYPAYAVTASESTVLLVPTPAFRRMAVEYETMRNFVFGLLSRRLASVMELVEEIAFGRMDERLTEYLVEKSGNDVLETTHQKIANDLGTSREVVSRLLKDFERKGSVKLSRNAVTLLRTGTAPDV